MHLKDWYQNEIQRNAKQCCITVGGWISNADERFLEITRHYIDANFALRNLVLNLKTNDVRTAQNVFEGLTEVMDDLNIKDKV